MNILLLIITAASLLLLFLAERRKHIGLQKLRSAGYHVFAPGISSWMRGACLALAIILLAGGILLLPKAESAIQQEPPVLFCILDCSMSMQALSGPERTRLQDAREYLRAVAAELPDWELALLTFEGNAFLDFPPSIDHDGWQQALAAVQTGFGSSPGSAPGEAMKLAQDSAAGLGITDAVLLLLSDGEINAPDPAGEKDLWTERRFPCIQVLCGKEGGARPVPGQNGWLKTSAGGVAMSTPDSNALKRRLETSRRPALLLSVEDGTTPALAAVRRFWGQGGSGSWARSGQIQSARAPLAIVLLVLSFLLLLAAMSPLFRHWLPPAVLCLCVLFGAGAVSQAPEAESAFSLTRRGNALCLEAQKEQAPEKWQAAADCFRRALHLQPGFRPAAANLEFALREWGRSAAASEREAPSAPEPDSTLNSLPAPPDSETGKIPAAASDRPAERSAASEDDSPGSSHPGRSTWRALRQRRPGRRIAAPECPPW